MTTEERLENLERELARAKRRNRWMVVVVGLGIVLLGVATAAAGWAFATGYRGAPPHWQFDYGDVPTVMVCGFVIAVTGLSGLVCVVLGLVRLLARRKGT
jgi:multisubunit Na+/H+ antiporter MnhB subunit